MACLNFSNNENEIIKAEPFYLKSLKATTLFQLTTNLKIRTFNREIDRFVKWNTNVKFTILTHEIELIGTLSSTVIFRCLKMSIDDCVDVTSKDQGWKFSNFACQLDYQFIIYYQNIRDTQNSSK